MTDELTHEELVDEVRDLDARLGAYRRKDLHQQELIEEQREELEQLRDRVAELEEIVDPDPGATEYEQLTKPQKVHRLRKHLVQEAAQTNGKYALKYREVKALFDGHPSAGHCYDLMDRAGELEGFGYDEGTGGEKRVRANLEAVNDETLLHAVNNAAPEEVA